METLCSNNLFKRRPLQRELRLVCSNAHTATHSHAHFFSVLAFRHIMTHCAHSQHFYGSRSDCPKPFHQVIFADLPHMGATETTSTTFLRGNVAVGRRPRSPLGSSAGTGRDQALRAAPHATRATMSTPEEQAQTAAAIQQLNVRLQQQETMVTVLTLQKRELCAAGAKPDCDDKRARTPRASWSGGHAGDRQARTDRRRSNEIRVLVVQAEVIPRSRGSAVSARVDDDRSVVDTETQRNAHQRRMCPQYTDVLHSRDDDGRSRVGQLSQRRRERRIRSLEAVRDGMGAQASNVVLWTVDERAVFRECTQMREEILDITRTQQYIDSQLVPMQLGANPKGKGKGKDVKGRGKGNDGKSESSKKAKSDNQRDCFYCNKSGHVKAEWRKKLKDLAEAARKPVAATPHPSDTTTIVPLQCLLPGESTRHVHHCHALREQRTNMRVFH